MHKILVGGVGLRLLLLQVDLVKLTVPEQKQYEFIAPMDRSDVCKEMICKCNIVDEVWSEGQWAAHEFTSFCFNSCDELTG